MPVATRKQRPVNRLAHGFAFSRRARNYARLLRHYRAKFKLPQPLVVRLTGFSARSVAKWSQGQSPSPKQETALVQMERLLEGLARVIEPAQVARWLKTPKSAFDGSTPLQVVERGEIDRLWRMLFDLESGQPG